MGVSSIGFTVGDYIDSRLSTPNLGALNWVESSDGSDLRYIDYPRSGSDFTSCGADRNLQ